MAKKAATKRITLPKIFEAACSPENAEQAAAVMHQFPQSVHTETVLGNFERGEPDIRSLLYYLAARFKPKSYLEIGVRLGFSMAMVAAASPKTAIVGCDMWMANYGGEEQIGAAAVEKRIKELGHVGGLCLISGNSQTALPKWLASHILLTFDLILVDADHTLSGALADLRLTLPLLNPGGFLVFDDLHDANLREVWRMIKDEFSPATDSGKNIRYHDQGIVGLIYKGGE